MTGAQSLQVAGEANKSQSTRKEYFTMAGKKIEGQIEQVEGKARVAVGKVTGKKSTQL